MNIYMIILRYLSSFIILFLVYLIRMSSVGTVIIIFKLDTLDVLKLWEIVPDLYFTANAHDIVTLIRMGCGNIVSQ